MYTKYVTNYYDNSYQDSIHLAGLYQQIKALEQENVRLQGKLGKRQATLSSLENQKSTAPFQIGETGAAKNAVVAVIPEEKGQQPESPQNPEKPKKNEKKNEVEEKVE
jgi:hypothetical protein